MKRSWFGNVSLAVPGRGLSLTAHPSISFPRRQVTVDTLCAKCR